MFRIGFNMNDPITSMDDRVVRCTTKALRAE